MNYLKKYFLINYIYNKKKLLKDIFQKILYKNILKNNFKRNC